MNPQLQKFARDTLKDGLARLPKGYQYKFKQVYSWYDRSLPINEVVDLIPEDKLDWVMEQVKGSLDKLGK